MDLFTIILCQKTSTNVPPLFKNKGKKTLTKARKFVIS